MLSKAEVADLEALDEFLLPELVNTQILVLLEVVTDEKQITVQQEQDDHVRQTISAYRSLIRVALLNVLHNAVKFSSAGFHEVLRISYSRVTAVFFSRQSDVHSRWRPGHPGGEATINACSRDSSAGGRPELLRTAELASASRSPSSQSNAAAEASPSTNPSRVAHAAVSISRWRDSQKRRVLVSHKSLELPTKSSS